MLEHSPTLSLRYERRTGIYEASLRLACSLIGSGYL
jgi:hypothetical protein